MSIETKITCDGCGKDDINYTGNCEDWYLQLGNVACAPWYVKRGERGGAVTSMALEPPIRNTMHFCGLKCLVTWCGGFKL